MPNVGVTVAGVGETILEGIGVTVTKLTAIVPGAGATVPGVGEA
jgi:hypothetical protein